MSFAELAEYRAHANEDFGVNEDRLNRAFVDLTVSILRGEFELTDQSSILCLSEQMPPTRLSADFLAERRLSLGEAVTSAVYVAHCWAPIDDMLRWCEDIRMQSIGCEATANSFPKAFHPDRANERSGAGPLKDRHAASSRDGRAPAPASSETGQSGSRSARVSRCGSPTTRSPARIVVAGAGGDAPRAWRAA